ncbi:ABC transporter substrate-binding protein [Microbacterium kribbense]|uniref:ABC transporter substrate-binding protein n=2 Tax=Microbacterium kribbense TaxID=433645 RepID=A0ABP7GV64_9MICO
MLPDAVKKAGYLTVASDVPYPPFEFYDTDGKTILGSDPDIAKALGELMGIQFRLQPVAQVNIIPGLSSGKYDLGLSGMADRKEREAAVTFVDYMRNAGTFLVTADAKHHPMTLPDICGLNVAVQSATTMADDATGQATKCTADGKQAPKVMEFQSQDDAVLALRSNRADVAMVTAGSGAFIMTQAKGQFDMTATYSAGSILGIPVRKDNMQLAKALEAGVQKLIDNGTYKKILTKWGLDKLNSIEKSGINGAIS